MNDTPRLRTTPRYRTTEELATLLRVSPRTVTNWAIAYKDSGGKEGLPAIRIGRRWLFPEDDVNAKLS